MPDREITFDALDAIGFRRWNDCFTYRCFPQPLWGNYRIDKDDEGRWKIYHGYKNEIYLYPETMKEVINFLNETSKKINGRDTSHSN